MTTLYAITGDSDAASTLYTIDPTNGNILSTIGATGENGITAISIRHTLGNAALYGWVSHNNNLNCHLVSINKLTGAATQIGPNVSFHVPDMSFDPANDVLYATKFVSGNGLYTINISTGALTSASINYSGGDQGLAWDANGLLWQKSGSTLNLLDVVALTQTFVVNIDTSTNNCLCFDSNNNCYSIFRNGTTTDFYSINTTTGHATHLGVINNPNISALCFDVPYQPRTDVQVAASTTPTTWTVSNPSEVTAISMTFTGSGACNNFAASGILADNTPFSMPVPTTCDNYNWLFNLVQGGITYTLNVKAQPDQVVGLSITPTNGCNDLTWTASNGATSYNIYRSTTTGTETLYEIDILTNSLNDCGSLSNPIANTTYFYKVEPVNGTFPGPKSNEVSVVSFNNYGITKTDSGAQTTSVTGGSPATLQSGLTTNTGDLIIMHVIADTADAFTVNPTPPVVTYNGNAMTAIEDTTFSDVPGVTTASDIRPFYSMYYYRAPSGMTGDIVINYPKNSAMAFLVKVVSGLVHGVIDPTGGGSQGSNSTCFAAPDPSTGGPTGHVTGNPASYVEQFVVGWMDTRYTNLGAGTWINDPASPPYFCCPVVADSQIHLTATYPLNGCCTTPPAPPGGYPIYIRAVTSSRCAPNNSACGAQLTGSAWSILNPSPGCDDTYANTTWDCIVLAFK